MRNLISMVPYYGQIIDNRILIFEFDYYSLTFEKLRSLVMEYITFMKNLLADDYIVGYYNRRETAMSEAYLYKNLDKILWDGMSGGFAFFGEVKSEKVYNKKTLKIFDKETEDIYFRLVHSGKLSSVSGDYLHEFAMNFNNKQGEELRQALLKVLNEEGRTLSNTYVSNDVFSFCQVSHYRHYPYLYRGRIQARFAYGSIKNELSFFEDSLREFSRKIALAFHNVNIHICLETNARTYHRGHQRYFNVNIQPTTFPGRNDLLYSEVVPYYYRQNADWYNILSPWQSKRFEYKPNDYGEDSVVKVNKLQEDIYEVYLDKSIDQVQMKDLKEVKKTLYDILSPGSSSIPLSDFYDMKNTEVESKPRGDWSYVPIFDEELEVTDTHIVFRHMPAR